MPEQEKRIELGGSVWMTVGGENLGGSGRADLIAFKPDNAKLFVYPNTGGGFDQDNPTP